MEKAAAESAAAAAENRKDRGRKANAQSQPSRGSVIATLSKRLEFLQRKVQEGGPR